MSDDKLFWWSIRAGRAAALVLIAMYAYAFYLIA